MGDCEASAAAHGLEVDGHVVESDDGHVIRNADPGRAECLHKTNRRYVVYDAHGVGSAVANH